MNVPVLRKTIRLPNLSAATIAVGAVMSFDERRVDFLTALRLFQRRLDLLLRAEHTSIIDFDDTTFHTRFMNRRIDQILAGLVTRSFRTTSLAGSFRGPLDAERFQNRLPVRLVFIARDQPWSPVFQAFRRFTHQQLRVLFRPFAVHHLQHKSMLRINRHVIPVVTTTGISGIVFVAIFLFLPNEVPLLVELKLLGLRGKIRRVRREVFPHALRQVACNESPFAGEFFPNDLFSASRSLPRHAQESKRPWIPEAANQKTPSPSAPKISSCKQDNTTTDVPCSCRNGLERGYYSRHELRVWNNFYSDSKNDSNRP